jgi:hypothetical protein
MSADPPYEKYIKFPRRKNNTTGIVPEDGLNVHVMELWVINSNLHRISKLAGTSPILTMVKVSL